MYYNQPACKFFICFVAVLMNEVARLLKTNNFVRDAVRATYVQNMFARKCR